MNSNSNPALDAEFDQVSKEAEQIGVLSVDAGNGYDKKHLVKVLPAAIEAQKATARLLNEAMESGVIPPAQA